MTAIAGIVRLDGGAADFATLDRMQDLLAPYGRDDQRQWRQGPAGLLRTLLRITPEDAQDRQPLVDGESGRVLVFDGRLDNREELARRLGLTPATAAAMPDSELVLHACRRWDTDALPHLLGDFALACWQPARRRLWLSRDPLGSRPLYWHRQTGFFAFATLPKALLAVPGVPRALCEERLADYLCLTPWVGPESLFKDIYRVEPGQVLVLHEGVIAVSRYHTFDPDAELRLGGDDDYLQALREHLDRAVAAQLRSAGPVASQLSSGFDSSTVTAVAAAQLARQGRRLRAYTAVPRAGFEGPVPKGRHADESIAARALVARFDNIDHVLVRPNGVSPIDNLRQATETLDRGPLNPCNGVWSEAIDADAAGQGAKVLLTGQLGNMSISYTGHEGLPALLRQGRWLAWWREAAGLKRASGRLRWRGLLGKSIGPFLPPSIWGAVQKLKGREWDRLSDYSAIHPAFLARMGGQRGRGRKTGWDLSYRPWADGRRMRIAVINRMDNGEYFTAANVHGLEMRDPTGDLRLLEFCLALPQRQFLRDGRTRWLFHRLMGEILPPEILLARSRGLQAADWFETTGGALPRIREELARMAQSGRVGEYLDLESLAAAVEAWPDGGWDTTPVVQAYRLKLLPGLPAGTFIRYVEEGSR